MLIAAYQNQHNEVRWQGYIVDNNDEFINFMQSEVAERLLDAEGEEEYASHLRGLGSTGFDIANIETLLNADEPDTLNWAVGEAFAEAILIREHSAIFPWNLKRDLRNENSSLSGADIVGFIEDGGNVRFLFGEIKTSIQRRYPPNVLYGREGMIHQLDAVYTRLIRLKTLVRWLFFRCKGTAYESTFDDACRTLFEGGLKGFTSFGILIRSGVQPDINDLNSRGICLGNTFEVPTKGNLEAYYLQCTLDEFTALATGGNL